MRRLILGGLLLLGSGLSVRAGELDRDGAKPAPPAAVAAPTGGGELDRESPALAHRFYGFGPHFGGYRGFYRPAWGGYYGGFAPSYYNFYRPYYPAYYGGFAPAFYSNYYSAYYPTYFGGGYYSAASYSFGFGGW